MESIEQKKLNVNSNQAFTLIANQLNQQILLRRRYIFMKNKLQLNGVRFFALLLIFFLSGSMAIGQNVGDYRTVATGNWSALATWQRLNALPTNWTTPTAVQGYPGQFGTTNITIQTGNDLTLDVSPAYSIVNLTTEGTARLINSTTTAGYVLSITGNIVLGEGSVLHDPINTKLNTLENTIILNGASQQTISSAYPASIAFFYNLKISNLTTNGGVLLNHSTVVVEVNLTVSSNCTYDLSTYLSNKTSSPNSIFTLEAGSKLRLAGSSGGATGSNFPTRISGGTFSYVIDPASTIEYYGNGSNPQTISSSYTTGTTPASQNIPYGNLILTNGDATGTATKNLTSNLTGIAGNLTVGDKVSFDLSTFTANRSANTVNFSLNGSAALKLAANNFPSGYSTNTISNNSTIEYNGTIAQTILAMNYGNLISSNSGPRTLASSGTIGVYGAFTPGTNVYAVSGSTVDFNGSTSQTIPAFTFNNLIINNNAGVTLSSDVMVNTSLLINSGKILTIPSTRQLNVLGTITNNAGVSGLIIKADPDNLLSNGSLIFHNAVGSPVQATVEMYSKASKATNYKWQFFGIPLRTMSPSPTFDGSYVRQMFETGTNTTEHWLQLTNASTLNSFTGYEITQVSPRTLYFQGELENSDFSSGKLSYTISATYPGQHLIGNPYTAAIDIKKINFGSTDAAIIDNTVYLYNTGSYADWTNTGSGSGSGTSAGQYIAVPILNAGTSGIPAQIPSMQAFLTRTMSDNVLAIVSIPYSAAGTIVKNTDLQRVKAVKNGSMKIDINGSRFSDRMWIITNPNCTHNFDNGWDGSKFGGSILSPQLYSIEADGDYQVNTVNDINNTELGFHAGEDSIYTLTFTNENLESSYKHIYLIDLLDSTTTEITENGSVYSFVAGSIDSPVKRFKIVTSIEKTKKDKKPDTHHKGLKIFCSHKTIIIDNSGGEKGDLMLYDSVFGRLIKKTTFNANGITTIPMNVRDGLYVAKGVTKSEELTISVIIK